MSSRKLLTIAMLVAVVGIAIAAVYIGMQLQGEPDVTPDDTSAASQEVWDAEIPRTQADRDLFASGWANLASAPFAAKKQYLFGDGARFRSETPILTVGDETLYGRDLNYYMFLLQYDVYTSSSILTDADVDKGIDELIYYSLVLQKAQELGLTTLDPSIYNSNTKDFTARNERISAMIPEVSKYFVDTAEGEYISIWFNNNSVPISVEEGKKIARAKIDNLYARLQSGEITMLEAAEEIATDQELLTKVDPAATSNAYFEFTVEKGGVQPFVDPALNDAIWALGEGQMSQVLLAHTPDDEELYGEGAGQEIAFVIIKVNSRTFADTYDSSEEFYISAPQESIDSGESVVNLTKGGSN